jgi:hypothetical protein
MTENWKMVRWSEARQITDILEWEDGPSAEVVPKTYFEELIAAEEMEKAAAFLSQSLGRLELVGWAVNSVRDMRASSPKRPKPSQMAALRAASMWLQDGNEDTRRQAEAAAAEAPNGSAEALLAMAVFYSGGSIAPEDVDTVPAPREAVGRFALGAILTAVAEHPDPKTAMMKCLTLGNSIAAGGL